MNRNRFLRRTGQYIGIALFLCCCLPAIAQAQSVWQITDTTQASQYYTLYALDCKGAWCVACFNDNDTEDTQYFPRLKIKQSFDNGRTWSEYDPKILIPNNYHNMAVDIIDNAHAIAVADQGIILKTSDRGTTWQQIPSPYNAYWYDVSFTDSLHGMIMGGRSCIVTRDGGENWGTTIFPQIVSACHAFGNGEFSVFDEEGNGKIYTTTDSWATYDTTDAPKQFAEDSAHVLGWGKCQWLGGDTMVAMGNEIYSDTVTHQTQSHGIMNFSYDGGKRWDTPIIDTVLSTVNRVSGYHGDTIYASGRRLNGLLRKSVDRGKTWATDTVKFTSVPPGTGLRFNVGLSYAADGTLIGAFDNSFLGCANFIARMIPGSLSVTQQPARSNIILYPNPASARVSITNASATHVEVRDLLGRNVLSQKINDFAIDITSLPEGMYEVLLYSGSKLSSAQKLAIVR